MVSDEKWARASNEYVKRRGATRPDGRNPESSLVLSDEVIDGDTDWQLANFGVTWSVFDVERIRPSGIERARHRFRGQLPVLIWNAAALEGNNFTLPEVMTLLDGTTVGGKTTEDAEQILALSEAYSELDELVGAGRFSLTKRLSDKLHGIVAVREAVESGHFRGEGQVQGGGGVHLANGGSVEGTPHGEGGALLRGHYDQLLTNLREIADSRRRALVYFASATRRQFYFDGNKRTARLMMTGELLSSGYEAVNVPFARKLEFNLALDSLFTTNDATELLRFLSTCATKE